MKIDFKKETFQEFEKVNKYFLKYPWEDQDAYVDFISNMYYFLSQACRLLASAASRCDLNLDLFHHRFIAHANEEKNHEKLVLHDLKALKTELKPCMFSMPPLWQIQFYLIENKNPLSLFGCILYLENLSLAEHIGPSIYKKCLQKYGKTATSYLRVHVEEDHDHIDKLYDVLQKLPEDSQDAVLYSLHITSSLYRNFISELYEKHTGSKQRQKELAA
ncbi:MAG: iron-containing redox enzyme family protein [Bdellovibrionaceae bacterium]|nr:iron-containing redox enzyme family protein [Pseudobdellovibrionaceae bacterium]